MTELENLQLRQGYYASPRWSWEIADCSMPMTFDTRSNCAFGCAYCFSFFQRGIGDPSEDYKHHRYSIVNVERVKKLFRGELPKSTFNWYIQRKHVLQWGGLSDGFDWYELKDGASLQLLDFFVREVEYPVSISSKNTWLLDYIDNGKYAKEAAPYWDVFREGGKKGIVHWKSSIISADEAKVKIVESGVGPTRERFRLLGELAKLGVVSTFRFRPFILGISADYPYTQRSYEQLDELFKMAKDNGCYSATTEFLCLESRAVDSAQERFRRIGVTAGIGPELLEWYRENSMKKAGLLRLNYEIKRPYMEAMFEIADKYGIKMFVSDAHHKEKSFHAGCCGLPEVGPLSNGFKGHFAQAILIAKKNGYVRWADIEEEARWLKNVPFTQKEGFNVGDTRAMADWMYLTMYDHLLNQWDNPNSFIGPNRYFGGALVAAPDRDRDGHIVYLYNKDFIEKRIFVESAQQIQEQLVAQGNDWKADGGTLGHVAYPVYVNGFTSNKQDLVQTIRALNASKVNFRLFVDEEAQEAVQAQFPDIEPEIIPAAFPSELQDGHQLQPAVNAYILRLAELEGYPTLWLLQADAHQSFRQGEQALSARAWLSGVEGLFAATGVPVGSSSALIHKTLARPEGLLE